MWRVKATGPVVGIEWNRTDRTPAYRLDNIRTRYSRRALKWHEYYRW